MTIKGRYGFDLFFAVLAAASLAACHNRSGREPAAVDGNELYFEYRVSGEESEDSVVCRFQCRRGGPDGETLLLDPTASVRLDSTVLVPDSAGFSGIYYELERPAAGFAGPHTWTVQGAKGAARTTGFHYFTFSVADLGPQVKRGDLVLELKDFPPGDRELHVLMVDTAWASNDLNALLPVHNGRLLIPEGELHQLASGPISLELRYEESRPLEANARPGSLHISYTLRRSLAITD